MLMYKYGGLLIYQSHDDDGIIEVVEGGGIRSLHFGTFACQSCSRLQEPYALELDYVRSMMGWMLFKDFQDTELCGTQNAEHVLMIGLGGGSITKHFLHHFPACRIKAIEYRRSVVSVARSHFGLPLDSRLKIIIDDAGHFLPSHTESHSGQYSLVMVDAFDHEGMADSICNEDFFRACKAVLNPDGMLVINLWGGANNPLFQKVSGWLGKIFNWKVLFLPVEGKGNIIGLAFNAEKPCYSMATLRERSLALEQHYQIEFPVFLKTLKKHNASTFNQLITL